MDKESIGLSFLWLVDDTVWETENVGIYINEVSWYVQLSTWMNHLKIYEFKYKADPPIARIEWEGDMLGRRDQKKRRDQEEGEGIRLARDRRAEASRRFVSKFHQRVFFSGRIFTENLVNLVSHDSYIVALEQRYPDGGYGSNFWQL